MLLLADNSLVGPLLMAAGIGLMIVVLMRRSTRRRRQSNRREAAPAPVNAAPAPTLSGPSEVELHDLARDVMGRIDSKMIVLQKLIAQSDRQIERLEALLERAEKERAKGGTEG